MVSYFLVWYRFGGRDGYLIWASDEESEQDRIVMDGGRLVSFAQGSDAEAYAAAQGWTIEAEKPTLHDLDAIRAWVDAPDAASVRCAEFLDAWNLFNDAALSLSGEMFEQRSAANDMAYDKLFWGCNVPDGPGNGERYTPSWDPEEVEELRRTLAAGLALIEAGVAR